MKIQLALLLMALAGGLAYVVFTSRVVRRWRRPTRPRPPYPAPEVSPAGPPPEVPPDLAWLRAVRGLEGTFLLARSLNRVGRSSSSEVVLSLETVSRHQCTIHHDGDGWVLVAQPSSNGTYLNSALLSPDHTGRLRDGDTVGIGTSIDLQIFIPGKGEIR
jgi:hypothetical protein